MLVADQRNDESRIPKLYELTSTTVVSAYNPKNNGWTQLASPALAGTFGAGSAGVFMPHRGPRGTLTAVSSASNFTLSALELSVTASVNQFADRGDGVGFKIRVYDPVAGKTGETFIVANTASATPQVSVSPALAWTPSTSSSYEFLSGRVYFITSGAVAAGMWKYYDVALNAWSGNLSTTNLPTIATDSTLICLDEQYVPANQLPGAGIFGQLTATASAAGTITGTAAGADAGVLANEFRNFQIRIVTDATTPGSVGQRRKIASHTAGASPVYTLNANWTTTPSASAVFVIEYPNDIILSTGGQTNVYTYTSDAAPGTNGGLGTADSWSTTTYGARGTAPAAGCAAIVGFGVSNVILAGVTTAALYGGTNDPQKNFRYSYIFNFRGGGTNTLDILDIAGAAAGAWTNGATADIPSGLSHWNTGATMAYDGVSLNGAFAYLNYAGGQYFMKFNVFSRGLDEWAWLQYPATTAVVGNKLAVLPYVDPSGSGPKISHLYTRRITAATVGASTELFESLISR